MWFDILKENEGDRVYAERIIPLFISRLKETFEVYEDSKGIHFQKKYGDKSEKYNSWVIGCSIEKIIFYYPQFPSSYDTNTKKIRISYQFYNDKYVDFHGRGGSLNIHFKNLTTLLDDLKLLDKKITAHFKIHYDKPLRFGGHFDLYNFALMIQEVMGKHVVGR